VVTGGTAKGPAPITSEVVAAGFPERRRVRRLLLLLVLVAAGAAAWTLRGRLGW